MAESKILLTHRLQREGRWAEATLFMDEERERLKAAGRRRAEANAGAWKAAAEKFPPLPPPAATDTEEEESVDALMALVKKLTDNSPPDYDEDKWAQDNWRYYFAPLRYADAPSLGAWSTMLYFFCEEWGEDIPIDEMIRIADLAYAPGVASRVKAEAACLMWELRVRYGVELPPALSEAIEAALLDAVNRVMSSGQPQQAV